MPASLKIHSPVLLEPLIAAFVIREKSEYFVIKLAGMIHVMAVNQFMHHCAVQNLWRHEHQKTVEVQIPVH